MLAVPALPAGPGRLEFTASHASTCTGVRGTILGPWQATQYIGTLDASAHSPVVMNAPILWKDGQNFGAWLRHWSAAGEMRWRQAWPAAAGHRVSRPLSGRAGPGRA